MNARKTVKMHDDANEITEVVLNKFDELMNI